MKSICILMTIGVMAWAALDVHAGIITSDMGRPQAWGTPGSQVNPAIGPDLVVCRTDDGFFSDSDPVLLMDFPPRAETADDPQDQEQRTADEHPASSSDEQDNPQVVSGQELPAHGELAVSPGDADWPGNLHGGSDMPAYLTAYDNTRTVVLTAVAAGAALLLFMRLAKRKNSAL